MSALKTLAGKLSFAHLAGLSVRGAKSRADEDPDKDPEETADDDDKNYKDDQDRSNGDSKKGSRADDEQPDDRDPDAEDDRPQDGDDNDEPKNKKGKRAKAEGDDDNDPEAEDDDDEDEMRGKSAAASARRRERARCAAIMGSRYAAGNVVLAANLAFNTTMTRKQALAVLRDTPPAATEPLHTGRASRNPRLGAGGEAAPTSQQAIESRWERTMKRVTGR